jgi:hypothetical protein
VALQEFYFYQVVGLRDASAQLADLEGYRDKVKVGVVNEFRLAWYPLGHSLGQIQHSLPLAPGESVNLAVIDWTRRDVDTRSEDTKEAEQLYHNQRRDRTITETVNAAVNEYQSGSSFMAGGGLSLGASVATGAAASGPAGAAIGLVGGLAASLGGSSSDSRGHRDITANTVQKLSDNITQASAAMRELQSTVVVQTTQSEKESIETRTVVNYNHNHSLTILYYEVLRHFRVVTESVGRRPVVLVQIPKDWIAGWDDPDQNKRYVADQNILENRAALQAALINPKLAEGFDAIERIVHDKRTTNAKWRAWNAMGWPILPPWFPPPIPPAPPLPLDDKTFTHITITIKVGGWISNPDRDHQDEYARIYAKLVGPNNKSSQAQTDLSKLTTGGDEGAENQLNPYGSLSIASQTSIFSGKLKDEINWSEINTVYIGVDPQKMEKIAIAYIKVAAIDKNGDSQILIEQDYGDGHLVINKPYTVYLPILTKNRPSPPPYPAPPMPRDDQIDDEVKRQELYDHLSRHPAHYRRALYLNQNVSDHAQQLDNIRLNDGSTVLEKVENRPLEMVGDVVAYPCTDGRWADHIRQVIMDSADPDVPEDPSDERLVTLPTRGLFAEAKLGHCNASEEIDNTRFWDWQKSPIPHFAPEIAPTTPVTPQPQQPNLAPTPFPQSLVNIVNPPAAPDPTGLAAALNVLGTPNIFRDMSGRAEVADLLKKLSDNSISIGDAANKAREIQAKYGSDLGSSGLRALGLSGRAGQSGSGVPSTLYDYGKSLQRGVDNRMQSPQRASQLYDYAAAQAARSLFQPVSDINGGASLTASDPLTAPLTEGEWRGVYLWLAKGIVGASPLTGDSDANADLIAGAIFCDRLVGTPEFGKGDPLLCVLPEVTAADPRVQTLRQKVLSRGPLIHWPAVRVGDRLTYVMERLIQVHVYPVNAAAGITGNVFAESGAIPSRVEGSGEATPLRSANFAGQQTDFTPEEVQNRSSTAQVGPQKPGVGLAQWTSDSRRTGLFQQTAPDGRPLGSSVLFNMDAQVDYLVGELQTWPGGLNNKLTSAGVTVDGASDDVVFDFEVPQSVLDASGNKRPRSDPQVQAEFATRRRYAQQALQAYQAARQQWP